MRIRMRWSPGRSELAGAATVLALVVLAAVTAFVIRAYQQWALALVIERDRQVAYLSAAQLKDQLVELSDLLQELAWSPEMRSGNFDAQKLALRGAASSLALFDGGVVLLDAHGTVRGTEPERNDLLGVDWSSEDFFRRILVTRVVIFSDATTDIPNGTPVVLIGMPVFSQNGELAAVLAGMFRLGDAKTSSFYASIVRLRIGQSGPTLLIDGKGRILYDSSYGRLGQVIQNYGLDSAAARVSGSARRVRGASGRDVVAALAPVPGTRWTLVTEDDWAAVVGPLLRYSALLLALLAVSVATTVAGTLLVLRHRHKYELQLRLAEEDRRASKLIEEKLLPKHVPGPAGWNLSVLHLSAQAEPSDFHDFTYLPDGRLMIVVGHVSFTGVESALAMACSRAILRASARRYLSADEVLAESNELLCPELKEGTSLICQYSALDPSSGQLEVASAGPLVPFRCGNSVTARVGLPSIPVGVTLGTRYRLEETSLHAGERLVLYSPGLVSSINRSREGTGTDRLAELLAWPASDGQALLQTLKSDLAAATGTGQAQTGDITVVVLERETGAKQS